ncbi:hypothetical protein Bbelb_357680 [Branchiostoma belcheri]|nr:hypothetical protein Bbelb_357680 [Branchiostoma belcheri]
MGMQAHSFFSVSSEPFVCLSGGPQAVEIPFAAASAACLQLTNHPVRTTESSGNARIPFFVGLAARLQYSQHRRDTGEPAVVWLPGYSTPGTVEIPGSLRWSGCQATVLPAPPAQASCDIQPYQPVVQQYRSRLVAMGAASGQSGRTGDSIGLFILDITSVQAFFKSAGNRIKDSQKVSILFRSMANLAGQKITSGYFLLSEGNTTASSCRLANQACQKITSGYFLLSEGRHVTCGSKVIQAQVDVVTVVMAPHRRVKVPKPRPKDGINQQTATHHRINTRLRAWQVFTGDLALQPGAYLNIF